MHGDIRRLCHYISEVEKRAAGTELLTLKQARGLRCKQQQRSQGAHLAGRADAVHAKAAGRIGDLVMVLQEVNELPRLQIQRWRAVRFVADVGALRPATTADFADNVAGVPRLFLARQLARIEQFCKKILDPG